MYVVQPSAVSIYYVNMVNWKSRYVL